MLYRRQSAASQSAENLGDVSLDSTASDDRARKRGFYANMAAQFAEWVEGGDVSSEDQIPSGQGAIMRDGLKKFAVYRDSAGLMHHFSAVCPHLGCIVAWNAAASTWDCPCHGSRFDALGHVVNGPANRDLPSVD